MLFTLLSTVACVHVGPGAAPIVGLSSPWSAAACADAQTDNDHDGLDDRCELSLASAFAPELIVDANDCIWREGDGPPRLGGGYFFAAQHTPGGDGVRIAYLPAYYRDCGWSGVACVFRGGDCGAHAGDSELLVIDLLPDEATGSWLTAGVFLSAHCLGRSDGRCGWYRDEALREFAWVDGTPGGAPRVWVAHGKHAHYPSRRACNRGHWFVESCDENRVSVRFPVFTARQNIGSRNTPWPGPGGCVTAEKLPLGEGGASVNGRECFWDPTTPFWGWQADRAGKAPTAYAKYLDLMADF